jgi:peptidoglycan/xylan/chitin deacetylase (PgdA/CDA1 family)
MFGKAFHNYLRRVLVSLLILIGGAIRHEKFALDESAALPPVRMVAVTFDDLPAASTRSDLQTHRAIMVKLLAKISHNQVPAIGFVNEAKLVENGSPSKARIALLRRWVDAGLELGNHTYSHPDLNSTALADFQDEVIRGEAVIARLMAAKGKKLRYFRHPYLHTGMSLEIKRQFEAFLAQRGYLVAPVTIDNSDWIYARAYDNAADREDKAMMRRVASAFIPYMDEKFAYFEGQSKALLGYEVRQILLLHANRLNSDTLDELVQMMKRRGYTFASLDEVLRDEAYASRDTYTGRGGISWIDRWAISQGKKRDFFRGEPLTPAFVQEEAGVRE